MNDIMQANPPQLHSNLLYIQRYRHQSRLVAEPAYFFTNMLSAESFISNIDANALSMEETEFEKNMESARALLSVLSNELDGDLDQSDRNATDVSRGGPLEPKRQSLSASSKDTDSTLRRNLSEAKSTSDQEVPNAKNQLMPSLSDLENKGAVMLLKEDIVSQVFRDYPYLFAHVGDLTLDNVEDLLNNYKQLVFKYVCLSKGLGAAPPPLSSSQTQKQKKVVTMKEPGDTIAVEPNNESKEQSMQDDGSDEVSLLEEENLESKMQQDVAAQGGGNDEISQ